MNIPPLSHKEIIDPFLDIFTFIIDRMRITLIEIGFAMQQIGRQSHLIRREDLILQRTKHQHRDVDLT